MKFKITGIMVVMIALSTCYSNSSTAAEYIYRDLMANTLASPGCATETAASASAAKPYNLNKYSKKFCQSQGYGWHVETIKDTGKVVCKYCNAKNSDQKQCHLEDVVVTCKRIKPGSVGMLPGKG